VAAALACSSPPDTPFFYVAMCHEPKCTFQAAGVNFVNMFRADDFYADTMEQ
jgi:hypothetical protein